MYGAKSWPNFSLCPPLCCHRRQPKGAIWVDSAQLSGINDEPVKSTSTMHLAKGLESRAVVVMACDDAIVPLQDRIETVSDNSDLEEVCGDLPTEAARHLLDSGPWRRVAYHDAAAFADSLESAVERAA